MELYDDEFLIDRIIKNIDKSGSKLSVIKPTFERKNKKTFITNYMEQTPIEKISFVRTGTEFKGEACRIWNR